MSRNARHGDRISDTSSWNRPLSVLLVGDEHDLAVGNALEMLAVRALAITLGGLHELVARDPTVLEGDLLHDRDRQTLARCTVRTNSPASNKESIVPVSNHA